MNSKQKKRRNEKKKHTLEERKSSTLVGAEGLEAMGELLSFQQMGTLRASFISTDE